MASFVCWMGTAVSRRRAAPHKHLSEARHIGGVAGTPLPRHAPSVIRCSRMYLYLNAQRLNPPTLCDARLDFACVGDYRH